MTIKIAFDGVPVEYSCHKFSGGEVQPKIVDAPTLPGHVHITCHAFSNDDIMELLLTIDAVWNWAIRYQGKFGSAPLLRVTVPYLPYARQDRVCAPGEAIGLEVMLSLFQHRGINLLEFWDVHNQATVNRYMPGDIPQWTNFTVDDFVTRIPKLFQPVVIAPDKGAIDRALLAAGVLDNAPIHQATKVRDAVTGNILATEIFLEHQGARDIIMVDDLCDGGRTFVELAKILRKKTTGRVLLYVTHGIFSQGLDVFHRLIDQVYCPNVFPNVGDHRLLTRI